MRIVDQSIRVCAGLILHNLYFCANELLLLTSNSLLSCSEPLVREFKGWRVYSSGACSQKQECGAQERSAKWRQSFYVLEKFLKLKKKKRDCFLK